MKKKILMGLLSSTLLLTACGNTEESPEENNPAEDPTEDVTDEDTGAEETNDSSEEVDEAEESSAATIKTLYTARSEEHTSELQSRFDLVCRLLLEKKKQNK